MRGRLPSPQGGEAAPTFRGVEPAKVSAPSSAGARVSRPRGVGTRASAGRLELDPDRAPLLPAGLEVLAGPELEDGREDALRHRGDGVVIGQDGVVVVLARV